MKRIIIILFIVLRKKIWNYFQCFFANWKHTVVI